MRKSLFSYMWKGRFFCAHRLSESNSAVSRERGFLETVLLLVDRSCTTTR